MDIIREPDGSTTFRGHIDMNAVLEGGVATTLEKLFLELKQEVKKEIKEKYVAQVLAEIDTRALVNAALLETIKDSLTPKRP